MSAEVVICSKLLHIIWICVLKIIDGNANGYDERFEELLQHWIGITTGLNTGRCATMSRDV